MIIKFESGKDKTKQAFTAPGPYTFFINCPDDQVVEVSVSRPKVVQANMDTHNPSMKKVDEPIDDGIFRLTKKDLKKLVAALNVVLKN